jgi:hypothetical protein
MLILRRRVPQASTNGTFSPPATDGSSTVRTQGVVMTTQTSASIVTNNFYSPNFGKPRIVIAPATRDAWRQVFVLSV